MEYDTFYVYRKKSKNINTCGIDGDRGPFAHTYPFFRFLAIVLLSKVMWETPVSPQRQDQGWWSRAQGGRDMSPELLSWRPGLGAVASATAPCWSPSRDAVPVFLPRDPSNGHHHPV